MKIFLVLSFLCLMGCTKAKDVVCDVEKQVENVSAGAIGTALKCSDMEEIQNDIHAIIGGFGVCKKANEFVGVCTLVGIGVSELASKGIPAKWKCDGGLGKEALKQAVTLACQTVIP